MYTYGSLHGVLLPNLAYLTSLVIGSIVQLLFHKAEQEKMIRYSRSRSSVGSMDPLIPAGVR